MRSFARFGPTVLRVLAGVRSARWSRSPDFSHRSRAPSHRDSGWSRSNSATARVPP